jgi:putative membrane protein insertion efficiency factor
MNVLAHMVIGALRVYRAVLSPLKQWVTGPGGVCRYAPTCSAYALEAVQRHGVWQGGALATRRICRCHPWGSAGFDPVPEKLPT